MDNGFWYSIPDSFADRVVVGAIVRIPLGGRRVRGYVVEVSNRPPDRLKAIVGVSGRMPVFDEGLRDALVWTAHHYVAPVSVALERAMPPNLPGPAPRRVARSGEESGPDSRYANGPTPAHPIDGVVSAVLDERRRPVSVLLSPWGDTSWIQSLHPLISASKSVLVVAATATEVASIASTARSIAMEKGSTVIEISGDHDDAELTRRWAIVASTPGCLVVGTPRVAAWPVAGLSLVVTLEEGRRAMKDRPTPTVSVRRLLMTRSRVEGFAQLYVGPTPSLELLASGPEILRHGGRAWGLVEVVDRNEEPPGSGLVSTRARTAIRSVLGQRGRVFVFTHRRGYAPAFRCARCRELRRCPTCGSRPEPGEACTRCGTATAGCLFCGGNRFEALGAGVGRVMQELGGAFAGAVTDADGQGPVVVGTERDLASVSEVDLAIVVDLDGLVLGSNFRAGEEALRILARVAGRVRRGRGHRLIAQTSMPGDRVVAALRRGDPIEYLTDEMEERRRLGFPPASEIMVIETRGDPGLDVDDDLRSLAGSEVAVMGPAESREGRRWLLQGPGLGGMKLALRPVVQRWRDSGTTVRVDVDPIDL